MAQYLLTSLFLYVPDHSAVEGKEVEKEDVVKEYDQEDNQAFQVHNLALLKARCQEFDLDVRGAHGESGGRTGALFDISNR